MILEYRKIIGGLLYYMQSLIDAIPEDDLDLTGDVKKAIKYYNENKERIRELATGDE
jgi:hypothetical protein